MLSSAGRGRCRCGDPGRETEAGVTACDRPTVPARAPRGLVDESSRDVQAAELPSPRRAQPRADFRKGREETVSRSGLPPSWAREGGAGAAEPQGLTRVLFHLQPSPVGTRATPSTGSRRATSLTSTTWSSSFATPGTWLRAPRGRSAWPAGSGATRCPPAEVSPPLLPLRPGAAAPGFCYAGADAGGLSPGVTLTRVG